MQLTNTFIETLERDLLETVDHYRSIILDTVEQDIEGTENWSFLRGRLLKALGDRGLSGRIRETLQIRLRTLSSSG